MNSNLKKFAFVPVLLLAFAPLSASAQRIPPAQEEDSIETLLAKDSDDPAINWKKCPYHRSG